MLVLKRRAGETIVIGDTIKIQVLKIEGGTVSLGVTAPREVRVLRAELLLSSSEEATFRTVGEDMRDRVWVRVREVL